MSRHEVIDPAAIFVYIVWLTSEGQWFCAKVGCLLLPESPGTPRYRSHPDLRGVGVTRNSSVQDSSGSGCWSYSERWNSDVTRKSFIQVSRNSGVPDLRGDLFTRISGVLDSPGSPGCRSNPKLRCPPVTLNVWVPESPGDRGYWSHPQLRGVEVTQISGVTELLGTLVCRGHLELLGARVSRNAEIPEWPGTPRHLEFRIRSTGYGILSNT